MTDSDAAQPRSPSLHPQTSSSTEEAPDVSAENARRQLAGLSRLLEITKAARQAADLERLGFVVVNDTIRLTPYRQAILVLGDRPRRLRVTQVSGLPDVERNAPFVA